MRTPPPPIVLPPDYKPRMLAEQIADITALIHDVDRDQRIGRLHPGFASFRRYQLKSVLHTLLGLQQAGSTTPSPSTKEPA